MVEDLSSDISQNNVRYLRELAESLEVCTPSYFTLKSYYLIKSSINEIKGSAYVPAKLSNQNFCCQRCRMYRTDVESMTRIKPGLPLNRFTKRLMKKQKELPLTRYQRKAIKCLKRVGCNKRVIMCAICKDESVMYLTKPVKVMQKIIMEVKEQKSNKKKKKRKRDKYAGLNPVAVSSVTPLMKIRRANKSKNYNLETNFKPTSEEEKLRVKTKQRNKLDLLLNCRKEEKRNLFNNFLKTI